MKKTCLHWRGDWRVKQTKTEVADHVSIASNKHPRLARRDFHIPHHRPACASRVRHSQASCNRHPKPARRPAKVIPSTTAPRRVSCQPHHYHHHHHHLSRGQVLLVPLDNTQRRPQWRCAGPVPHASFARSKLPLTSRLRGSSCPCAPQERVWPARPRRGQGPLEPKGGVPA